VDINHSNIASLASLTREFDVANSFAYVVAMSLHENSSLVCGELAMDDDGDMLNDNGLCRGLLDRRY